MAVVINEFEVVAAPPPATASPPKGPPKPERPPASSTTHDIASVLQRQADRGERLRAH
jgi:hypothetical protein